MFGIGIQEFGIIVVVALLVFGPKRLPELARTLGRGLGEFRRASNDLRQSLALDDLQNDLRNDLHSAGSILKPQNSSDRPAQAGDELDAKVAPIAAASTVATDASPEKMPAASSPAESVADRAAAHPGELPLDNDYDHHPEVAAQGEVDGDPNAPGKAPTEGDGDSDTRRD